MSQKTLSFAACISFLSILTLLCAAQFLFPPAKAGALQAGSLASQSPEPFALIKSITVNRDKKLEPELSEVKVRRANQTEEAGRANMFLYRDDEVTTGPTAQVAILFLDNPQVKDNEVLLDVDTVVRIGSIFTRIGRVLVRVKGIFDTRTERVKLGVQGTEYELTVARDGTNTIKVLKGGVSITSVSLAKNFSDTTPASVMPLFLRTAFAVQEPLTQQKEMEFVVVSGQVSNLERDFIFSNRCQRKHVFQVRGPRNLDWFQMLGADQFSVDAQASRTIKFVFRADATRVPVGTQENEIVARCLDCNQEPSCDLGGLLVPISIKVIGSGQPVPPPPPLDQPVASSIQSAVATKQEQVTVPNAGGLIKTNASAEQLQQTLNWSDDIILEGQPTYAAQSVVSHFRSWEERDNAFRQARRDSILNNDSKSNDVLAQVYVDWGNGAKAEQELKESALNSADPERWTTLAEAYRLMGRLDEAETALNRALDIDPARTRTLNTLGNIYLDRAKAAKERKNFTLAKDFLDRASAAYTKAARRPAEQHHLQTGASPANQANVQTVVRSNLAQVYLTLGEMAREQGNAPEALAQYRTATRTFQDAAALDHNNPFAFAGIGDAYRETAEVFVSRDEKANADQYFAMSKDHYVQAAKLHGDMSEAYVGLGRIADDNGQPDVAIRYFSKAAALRPEQPEPHYYLAIALAPVNPRAAAQQAAAYLKIESEPFRGGSKANDAQLVRTERYEQRGPGPSGGAISGGATLTQMPNLVGRNRDEAVRELERSGFVLAKIEEIQGDQPHGTVIDQQPKPGQRVAKGTPIDLVIARGLAAAQPMLKVPGLKGDDPKKAMQELRQKGFDPRMEAEAECNATGRVLYSTPAKDALVASGSVVTIYVSSPGPNAVPIPRVTGLLRSEAEEELRRANLRARLAGTEATNSRAPDTVVRQKPEERKMSMPGCEIALTLAIPIPQVRVPSFVNQSREQALSQLPRYSLGGGGLVRGTITEAQNCDYSGRVIQQRPQAGEMVDQGTSVDLVIGKCTGDDVGPAPQQPKHVLVPYVINMWFAEAKKLLESKGLVAEYQYGDCNELKVSIQDPHAEAYVLPGTHVKLGCPIR